jgi:hypothetical protein
MVKFNDLARFRNFPKKLSSFGASLVLIINYKIHNL